MLKEFYQCRLFDYVHLDSAIVLLVLCVSFLLLLLYQTALTLELDAQCAKRAKFRQENWSPHTHTNKNNVHIKNQPSHISDVCWFFSIDDHLKHTSFFAHFLSLSVFVFSLKDVLCFVYENWIVRQMQFLFLYVFISFSVWHSMMCSSTYIRVI